MTFKEVSKLIQTRFADLAKNATVLFEVDADRDKIWETYLESFPAGTNEIFRERREYDCSCCKTFIRNLGKAVFIVGNEMCTIWDIQTGDTTFQPVMDAMDAYIKSCAINNVYYSDVALIGTPENKEKIGDQILKWEHFNISLPSKFVNRGSEAQFKAKHRDNRTVLETSLEKITEDSLLTILELVVSKTLYRGEEKQPLIEQFLELKREYSQLSENEINNWMWRTSYAKGSTMSKFKNDVIGTLLINLSTGMDLEEAVGKYEAMVAPHNYQRSKPIYTKGMLEKAQKTVEELGLLNSLPRRFAEEVDIGINDVLYVDRDTAMMMGENIFDELAAEIPENLKKFDKVEEIGIQQFIDTVLPTARELEVMVENKHATNFCSLITAKDQTSRNLFPWGNTSWAYAGNLTDSAMKENVKLAGGNVNGDLRFSIQWNDRELDQNDLDAHCREPGYTIYFGNRTSTSPSGGNLDVDITGPRSGIPAVENIIYANKSRMKDGDYLMRVHCYSNRGGAGGFRAEIEFDGVIHSFDYNKPVRGTEMIDVAVVTLKNGQFTMVTKLPAETQNREIWGIHTNKFVRVSVVCMSPNHWNDSAIGNKHYMFMLKGCKNPERPNGFFNEYLGSELREHRKVFEALASKMRVEDSDYQLSGLGFSSTKRAYIIVRVKGQVERTMKVLF